MPQYVYRCPQGHETELVRPIGTDTVSCKQCDDLMQRRTVNHIEIRGPTVNTGGMASRFLEASAEREHIYQKVEANTGEPVQRPNDWAAPRARAKEMLRRGELDTKKLAREMEHHSYAPTQLKAG